jgi:hypothetical protein
MGHRLAGDPAHRRCAYRAYHQFTPDLAENAFQAVFCRDYEPKIVVADELLVAIHRGRPADRRPGLPMTTIR